ncbi:hypothetical protein GGX14DRAFT_564028 [Mycena pura]|uniref:Uncharacterized protein n=1 Tax=Mycena pura TaxID=153505 RepID=A0AAD6YC49_9AGAR|nr:hypothetical protein GGX14DRAFT_564028 [Mycena pura]
MGRRAKYFTQEEKAQVDRARARKYNASERGVEVRTQRRQLVHTSKTAKKRIPRLIPPPDIIRRLAFFEIDCDSQRLHAACEADFDYTHLRAWLKQPPFSLSQNDTRTYNDEGEEQDVDSEAYIAATHALEMELHGVRLRREHEHDQRRRDELHHLGWHAAMDNVRRDVQGLLESWQEVLALKALYDEQTQPRQFAMWTHYRDWLARTIYRLYYLHYIPAPS